MKIISRQFWIKSTNSELLSLLTLINRLMISFFKIKGLRVRSSNTCQINLLKKKLHLSRYFLDKIQLFPNKKSSLETLFSCSFWSFFVVWSIYWLHAIGIAGPCMDKSNQMLTYSFRDNLKLKLGMILKYNLHDVMYVNKELRSGCQ